MADKLTLSTQQLKALDIIKNVFLTANAGSGKTFILTKRFIKTIIEKDPKISEVVVITFTEAAAGDLQIKITQELDLQLRKISDQQVAKKIKYFRDSIFNAKISTIHSFCSDILKKYPIEAGIDFNFSIAASFEIDNLLDVSIKFAISQLLKDENEKEKVKEIIARYSKKTIFGFLYFIYHKRFHINNFYNNDDLFDFNKEVERINEVYKKFFESSQIKDKISDFINNLDSLINFIKENGKNELINKLKTLKNYIKNENYYEFLLYLEEIDSLIFTSDRKSYRKSLFKSHPAFEVLITQINVFLDPLRKILIHYGDFELQRLEDIKTLLKIYRIAEEKIEEEKSNKSLLDFNDLLIKTYQLLSKEEAVLKDLSENILFLFIDEFQDTDTIQYEIAKLLTNNFDEKHNVFFIGDEKQSIFGFRDANLEIFNKAKSDIIKSNRERFNFSDDEIINEEILGAIILPENFRILINNVAFINEYFKFKMYYSERNIAWDALRATKYNPLIVGRSSEGKGKVELLINNDDKVEEAKLIATKILELVNNENQFIYVKDKETGTEKKKRIDFEDIAILIRERKLLPEIEKALINNDIPYFVFSGTGYFATEEINDWIHYFKFLANPKDDIALLTILRSPFYLLNDEEIYHIGTFSQADCFFEKLSNYCRDNKSETKFINIYEDLNHKLSLRGNISLSQMIDEILLTTKYEAVLNQSRRARQIFANIDKLCQIAREFENEGFVDLYDFANYLQKMKTGELDESQAVISDVYNSVKIMTIHKSKGLEFPVVIIPEIMDDGLSISLDAGAIDFEQNTGLLFKYPAEDDNYFTKTTLIGSMIKANQACNEEIRLKYVAFTRARDYLILSVSKNNLLKNEIEKIFNCSIDGKDHITYNTKVKILNYKSDEAIIDEQECECSFSLYNNVKTEDEVINRINDEPIELKFKNYSEIVDNEDFYFTASQIVTYKNCVNKYILKYIYEYEELTDDADNEFLFKLEDNQITQREFGIYLHSLLSEVNSSVSGKKFSENLVELFIQKNKLDVVKNIKQKFIDDLNRIFLDEEISEYLNSKNQFSEFNITALLEGNILSGQIDKLILKDDEIVIIDWKTDRIRNLEEEILKTKVNNYFEQIKFYSYLAYRHFGINRIKGMIVFVDELISKYSFEFDEESLLQYEKEIIKIIDKIKKFDFELSEENEEKCKYCNYKYNQKCYLRL